MSSSPRQEQVLVLFASQSGNSKRAALEIADQLPNKLSTPNLTVTSRHMLLDDFLEQAEWTRLVVIVTSSYGAGQAPLGGHRFRELCNALVKQPREGMLKGISFALLGLGDSKYMTYLRNPTQVDEALQLTGATRVGIFGKANASGDQRAVISQWIDGIWPSLEAVVKTPSPSKERLADIQSDTVRLRRELGPDFMPEAKSNS